MNDLATPERWLSVVGWEGLYEVSDLGRVRSLPRRGASGRRWYGGKILKHYIGIGTRGYPVVGLSRDGTESNHPVHQLVLRAFRGPCPPGREALHGPAGKTDASLANLSYGTRAENIADRVRDGQDNRGDRCYAAKLTWTAVADIRVRADGLPALHRRRLIGDLEDALARQYGVSRQAINAVVLRKTWLHPPS